MWRQQHVVGHHAYTNLHGADPDLCTAADPDLRRVTPLQPRRPQHVRPRPRWRASCAAPCRPTPLRRRRHQRHLRRLARRRSQRYLGASRWHGVTGQGRGLGPAWGRATGIRCGKRPKLARGGRRRRRGRSAATHGILRAAGPPQGLAQGLAGRRRTSTCTCSRCTACWP